MNWRQRDPKRQKYRKKMSKQSKMTAEHSLAADTNRSENQSRFWNSWGGKPRFLSWFDWHYSHEQKQRKPESPINALSQYKHNLRPFKRPQDETFCENKNAIVIFCPLPTLSIPIQWLFKVGSKSSTDIQNNCLATLPAWVEPRAVGINLAGHEEPPFF